MPDEPHFPPERSDLPPVPSDPPTVMPPVPPDTPPATPGVFPAVPGTPSVPPDLPPMAPPAANVLPATQGVPPVPPGTPGAAEPASQPGAPPPWLVPGVLAAGRGHEDDANGFAAGGELDQMGPGPVLAWHAAGAIDDGLGVLDDDELTGLLCAARRLSRGPRRSRCGPSASSLPAAALMPPRPVTCASAITSVMRSRRP